MNYVNPNTQQLSVTYDSITYYANYYKPATLLTGVVDEAYSNWAAGTTYAVGDFAIIPELKRIYRSASENTGKFPAIENSIDWVFWATLNSYNMFASDINIGSKTNGTNKVMEFDFSRSDTIAGLDLDFILAQVILFSTTGINYLGDYVPATIYNTDDAVLDGGILYSSKIDTNTGNTPGTSPIQWEVRNDLIFYNEAINGNDIGCLSYGEYFYTDAKINKRVVIAGLEWLPSSILRITLDGEASIGTIVYGKEEELGATLVGSSLTFEDKSTISTDAISGFRTVKRYGSVRVIDCSIIYETDDFNVLAQKISGILSRNILWIPTDLDKFSEAVDIGYLEKWRLPMEAASKSQTQATIVGVAR